MGGKQSKDKKAQLSLSEPQPKPAMDTTTQTQAPDSTTEPGPAWSALLSENNWTGLLEPLDLHLRTLILRCGDFCQGTCDAFNNDANSKYAGSSRYGHLPTQPPRRTLGLQICTERKQI